MGSIKRQLIVCKSNKETAKYQGSQAVNIVGRFLYNHIDGAYNIKRSANSVDVYFIILYQKKEELREDSDKDMHEMKLNINITTYDDKLRMNIIELSPEERTLGFNTFALAKFDDLNSGYNLVMKTLEKRLNKYYEDYDFIF